VDEVLQVRPTRGVELERAGESVEDGVGGLEVAALLEPGVVVSADPRELSDLFTTQSGHAAEGGVRQPDVGRLQLSPTSAQVLTKLNHQRHPSSIGLLGTRDCGSSRQYAWTSPR
jgi:hypothetical protein